MRAHRSAATALPVRVLGPGGVITITFMDHAMSERPVSGASPAELASQLQQARTRTHRLTDELSSEQLMGLKLDIVNPVLWEIGHVGWFHEYWTLRHSHGQAPLIDRADDLWNSSTVAHDTRWKSRSAGSRRHLCLSGGGSGTPMRSSHLRRFSGGRSLFLRTGGPPRGHARRSTDLHARNARLSAAAESRRSRVGLPPGLCRAMPKWPAALGGSAPHALRDLSLITRNGRTKSNSIRSALHARRSPIANLQHLLRPAVTAVREFWSDDGWTWRERQRAERPIYWQPKSDGVVDVAPLRSHRGPRSGRSGCFRQLARGRGLVPLCPAPIADRGGVGSGGDRRTERRRQPPLRGEAALAVGRRRTDAPACKSGFCVRRSARRCGLSRGRQRLRLPADGRQCLGMDGLRLRAIPGLCRRSLRRLFKAVVRFAEGVARRVLGDERKDSSTDVPEFFSSRSK